MATESIISNDQLMMQENVAYNIVQQRNTNSNENVYEIPNAPQTVARNAVEPIARKIQKKMRQCIKCSNLATAFAILLAALAVVLSVIQQTNTPKQDQKLQLCESNILSLYKALNETTDGLRSEVLRLLENISRQLPSETEPNPTITLPIKQATTSTATELTATTP